MEKLDEQEVDLSNELDDEMETQEEVKFVELMNSGAFLEEITISMQEAAQRLTQAQFRKLKHLMQVYFRDY